MKNLAKLALEATNRNLATKTAKKGVNDMLVELLLNKKLTKNEIIAEITMMRLLDEMPELNEETFMNDEVQKKFAAINTTVKNGFEQSWAKGQNNASFHYNESFKQYELKKVGEQYTIVNK